MTTVGLALMPQNSLQQMLPTMAFVSFDWVRAGRWMAPAQKAH